MSKLATLILAHAVLIDGTGRQAISDATVIIEGDRIKEVLTAAQAKARAPIADAETRDLGGLTLMPGLIDAHVHLTIWSANFQELRAAPSPAAAALAVKEIEATLMRGFTTVRDAGGLHPWFKDAVASGKLIGPRILVSGRALSQTGGHGDHRALGDSGPPPDAWYQPKVADGVDAVREAVREQLRTGVDQIKVMASGGVMSSADEIEASQYSPEELKAIVDEARRANKYVMAHAYSGKAVLSAIQAGVRTIEHGNLIDEAGARSMKAAGAYLVPTMVTYEELWKSAKKIGLSDAQVKKLETAREKSIQGLKLARKMGVKIGLGSDLLGSMRARQAAALEVQGQVQPAMEVIVSATKINAEIVRLQDQIGTVEPGKQADLIVVRGDPLKDLRIFQDPENVVLIMKGGAVFKDMVARR